MMHKDSKLTPQEELDLTQAALVKEWLQHKAWLEVVKPYLEAKIRHSWVDPRKVKNKEDFFYEYSTAWGWSQASDEFLSYLNSFVDKANYLTKKKTGEIEKSFKIGA